MFLEETWLSFAARTLAAGVLWAGCGSDTDRPSEPLLVGDGGPRPTRDAGPPLDCTTSLSHQDADYDGFSPDLGDCDDCNPEVNPVALDVPGNGIDEDCDGSDLDQPMSCDAPLRADSDTPADAARALGMCNVAAQIDRHWGLRSAKWKRIDGGDELEDPLQVWLPESFGAVTPHEGARLFVMSTGVARDADDKEFTPECDLFTSADQGMGDFSNGVVPPAPYPVDSSQCPADSLGSEGALAYNDVGLELYLRAPSNARSLAFDSIFFTHEYPSWVCSPFNDFFVVFMTPTPKGLDANRRSKDDKNVVYDSRGDLVGVNTALLASCRESDLAKREIPCELGPALLAGTGFDRGEATCGVTAENQEVGGASTGWLRTVVPVEPGSMLTLHFMLWDSDDPSLDSTVVIDNLHFEAAAQEKPTTRPITSAL